MGVPVVGLPVGGNFENTVGIAVGVAVGRSVGTSVGGCVNPFVGKSVENSAGEKVGASVSVGHVSQLAGQALKSPERGFVQLRTRTNV